MFDPAPDPRAALRACRARDYNVQSIPMFLTLEDLTAEGREVSQNENGYLAALAKHYLGELPGEPAHAAQEVLAAHHFAPADGESPRGPLLRVVNFHNTPRDRRGEYERQILALGAGFAPVGEADLHDLISGGATPKPGVLPVFYEGYRNNYEVALPLLERAGLRGWFFIITGFIDTPVEDQYAFALSHHVGLAGDDRPGERCAMTWDELRDVVARGHVVACHTATHRAATSISGPEDARRELVGSRGRLEDELGAEVEALAWFRGAPYGEDPRVDGAVREAGYGLVFSNAQVQRIARRGA